MYKVVGKTIISSSQILIAVFRSAESLKGCRCWMTQVASIFESQYYRDPVIRDDGKEISETIHLLRAFVIDHDMD